MMDHLANHGGTRRLRVLALDDLVHVVELSALLLETAADGGLVAMVDVTLLRGGDNSFVDLGSDLDGLHGLNGGVVVFLMDLPVCVRSAPRPVDDT